MTRRIFFTRGKGVGAHGDHEPVVAFPHFLCPLPKDRSLAMKADRAGKVSFGDKTSFHGILGNAPLIG
jgi:hypothetical protein